ncbi:DNA ligase [Povalibacter sp.]|uniref:DNA ligase n=1 Tax=Povalibacter sp. TaxID=1962978 RepID=UPI002F422751
MERRYFITSLLLLSADALASNAAPLLLAKRFHDRVFVADYWLSEKYDGVRALWNGRELLSRTGNPIHAPHWFLMGLPASPLDGELWIDRGQFEQVVATVRDAEPDDAAWRRIRFMVFDLPQHGGTFDQRLTELRQLIASLPHPWLRLVPQFRARDQDELFAMLHRIIAAGGEGVMLHRGSSLYRAGRSDDLLKLKQHDDAEARVVGYLPGKGKYATLLGALRVERPDGMQFNLGTGFTDAQRRHPPAIGVWVTYSYHGLTDNGVPRFASFVRVREQ